MARISIKQRRFTIMIAVLVIYTYIVLGYELTYGDAFAKTGHKAGSFHYKRLAVDFNLFINGKYTRKTEDHAPIGRFWKLMGGTWGGDFRRKDGNHYSLGE